MKRFLMTVVLTCVLSLSVSAGDVHSGDSPAPVPAATPHMTVSAEEIPTEIGVTATSDALHQLLEAAQSTVLWMLSFA